MAERRGGTVCRQYVRWVGAPALAGLRVLIFRGNQLGEKSHIAISGLTLGGIGAGCQRDQRPAFGRARFAVRLGPMTSQLMGPRSRWVNFAKPHRDTRLDSGQSNVFRRLMGKWRAAPVNGAGTLEKTRILNLFNDWP